MSPYWGAERDLFGPVAAGPSVSRLINALAAAGPKVLTVMRTARAEVRTRVSGLGGADGPAADRVIVDIDGVLVHPAFTLPRPWKGTSHKNHVPTNEPNRTHERSGLGSSRRHRQLPTDNELLCHL